MHFCSVCSLADHRYNSVRCTLGTSFMSGRLAVTPLGPQMLLGFARDAGQCTQRPNKGHRALLR